MGRLAAHDLDRVLVAQVVRALDGVERVRLPGVLGVQRRVDAALGRVGVRADGVDLGDDADGCAGLRRGEGGALAGEAGSDDEDVVLGHWWGEAAAILCERGALPGYGHGGRSGRTGRSARRTWSTVTTPRRPPSRVHGHDRAQAGQALAAQQRLERLVESTRRPLAPLAVGGHHRRHGAARRATGSGTDSTALRGHQARRAGRRRRPPGTRASRSAGRTRRRPGRGSARRGPPPARRPSRRPRAGPRSGSVISVCTSAWRAAWPRK